MTTPTCEISRRSLIGGEDVPEFDSDACRSDAAYLLLFDPEYHATHHCAACLKHTILARQHPHVHMLSVSSLRSTESK